jgi:hypothetical protein
MLETNAPMRSQSSADAAPMRRRIKRVDGRTKHARRIRTLIATYSEQLGDYADTDRIRRTAELVVIAEDLRERQLNGEPVDLAELFKAEGVSERALRALRLDQKRERSHVPLRDQLAAEFADD